VLPDDQLPARARCTDCGVRYETTLPLEGRYVEHCPLCGARSAVVALVPDPPRAAAPDVAAEIG
jgi:DNA-directed RNA polymerase subunit RPC12/RpoP